jgi:hypothetical protein
MTYLEMFHGNMEHIVVLLQDIDHCGYACWLLIEVCCLRLAGQKAVKPI